MSLDGLGARKPAPPFLKLKRNLPPSRDNHAMIAFSTCWNSGRHTSGDEMLREIQTLGFNLIELGHGIRISLMPGIQKMFDAGEVRFSSLHNFCPLPVEVMSASPDCYEFAAAGKSERDRAVKQTLQTVDFAERLNAPFVVLHCGSISMNPITDELIALAQKGGLLSRKYVRKKIDAVRTRDRSAHVRLPHAGWEVAGPRSSTTFSWRHATGAAHTHVATKLPDGVGDQPAFIGRRNHAITRDLEGTFRRVKKIFLTLFQIAVTVGMLIWVFHDPNQRAKMAEALRTADYRWVGAGIFAYVLVEVFAAFR